MKTVKSLLWIVILMWALAGLSAYFAIPSFMTFLEEPTPLEQVDFSKDVEGLYVSGTIYGIYGSYCTETEDGKTTKKEYLIDADDYYYMGLLAEGKDMEAANKLAEATQEFLNSEQDYSLITPYQYEVKGVITAMPSDSLDFYHESIDWYSLDDQSKDLYLPYYLKVNSFGRYNASQLTMMVMVIALLFLVGLIFLILILSGRYQKYVKRYIKNSTNPELARQKIDSFVKNTEEVNKLRYNQDFICGQYKGTTAFGETSKLAWAYLNTITHKRNFISVSTTYELVLGFADGSLQPAEVKSEAIAREHMANLEKMCPQAIFGFSNELATLFRNDLNGFLNKRFQHTEGMNSSLNS